MSSMNAPKRFGDTVAPVVLVAMLMVELPAVPMYAASRGAQRRVVEMHVVDIAVDEIACARH